MIYALCVLGGIVAGGGGAALVIISKEDKTPIQAEQVATKQQEIIKNLTEPDLLEVPCSKDFIKEFGVDLCREMFCRMTTRGIDSKTSGSDCEQISNLINSKEILATCKIDDNNQDCFDLFWRRK